MQNPPPPTGPQYPPPGPPQYASGGGVDKKTGAILSYLLWWITGVIFLFVGKNDPDVKFHAAQSIVFFGSISIVGYVINIVSWYAFSGLGLLSTLIWLFGVVIWVICLMKANSGGGARFEIPLVGGVVTGFAEQLANAV
jgi:uncharacterized membrane protein